MVLVFSLIIVVTTCDARRPRHVRHAPASAPGAATPQEVSEQVKKSISGVEKRVENALEATVKSPELAVLDRLSGELVKCLGEVKGNKGVEGQIDTAIAALAKIIKDSGVEGKELKDVRAQAGDIEKTLNNLKSQEIPALATRLEELNKQTNEWRKIYKLQVALAGPAGAKEKLKAAAETELERWREKMMYAKPSNQTTQKSPPPREIPTQEASAARKEEEVRKAEEAEARRKEQEQVAAKRRADAAAETERKADERRKAEEARIAMLPKTITVPSDEASISAAMIRAKKGDTIKVRAGRYEDQITFKDGVHLAGDRRKDVTVYCAANNVALVIQDCISGSISGITFEHVGTAVDPHSSAVIYIANSHVEISDCRVQKAGGFGIMIDKGASPVIRDCVVERSTWSGIIVSDSGTKPRLKSNQCRENGESGVYFLRGSYGVMEKNQCEGNSNGIMVAGMGTSVTLTGNHCFGSHRLNGSGGIGISLQDGATGSLIGNTVENNESCGIWVGNAASFNIRGNICRTNGKSGLEFRFASTGVATGNTCERNIGAGIWVGDQGTSPEISGNAIFGNSGNGIYIASGAAPRLGQNSISGNGYSPIYYEKTSEQSSQAPGGIDRSSLQQFFDRIWKHNYSSDPNEWASDFADVSNYGYNQSGMTSREAVASDRKKLVDRWPARSYQLVGTPQYGIDANSSEGYLEYRFNYSYSGQGKPAYARGTSHVSMKITLLNGGLYITQFNEVVDRR